MSKCLFNMPAKILALILLALSTVGISSGQVSRSNNKSSNPHRGQYQRMATGRSAYHTLEIRNGALWAYGYNNNGQLGDGTTVNRTTPTQIGTDTKWLNLAGGANFSIALKSDGTLWGWGENSNGQLGDNTTTDRHAPIQIGTDTKWVSIAAGDYHSLGIKSDGTLWAWGSNNNGQLGDGTTTNRLIPTQIGTDTTWVSITAGAHTVALKSNGTLWAWGYNGEGEVGDGTTTNRSIPTHIGTDVDWSSISAGDGHCLALKSDGTLWAWGGNSFGALGDGTTTDRHAPTKIGVGNNWASIAGGFLHSIALKSDGSLWAWGYNPYGELGDGTTVDKHAPTHIGSATDWVSIGAGGDLTLALKSDGTLWSWGFNGFGSLGDGTTVDKTSPTQAQRALKMWLTSASGADYTTAIRGDGTLWAWGYNNQNELGDGTTTNKAIAEQIGSSNKWVSVACGAYHAFGLKCDGTLWAWGVNGYGRLGDGTTIQRANPVQLAGSDWVSLSGGGAHTLALKSNGTLWAWGYNADGELGDGTTTNSASPVQITGTTWVSVSAGGQHSLAVKSDGTLWAWGYNSFGQLGDGTTTQRTSPVRVGTDTTWISAAAGQSYSVALKCNGTLWAWGQNAYGEVGDGSTTQRNSPVQIPGITWISAACGSVHTLATRSNGTLWACGYNLEGQLGDGSTTSRTVMTQATGVADAISIGKGGYAFHSAIIKASRSNVCLAGRNGSGQLGDGTTTDNSAFNCSNSVCASATPATVATTYSGRPLSGTGNRTDFQLNCALVASVTPNGTTNALTGTATSKVFIDASVQTYSGQPYVQRHYDIEPATTPNTATATVTLYYTQAEFTAFNAARGTLPALPINAADAANNKANLRVTQFHGVPTGGNGPGNYPATWGGTGPAHVLITPTSVTWDADNSWWAVAFPVTGFSGFFVNTGANTPLPIRLLSFSAQKTGRANRLDWSTATETAGATFEVTRSADGVDFGALGNSIESKGSNSSYSYYDEQPLRRINYYRLRMIEADGRGSFSNIAVVSNGAAGEGGIIVSPVPATNSITITNDDTSLMGSTAVITDMLGREVYRFALSHVMHVDVHAWAAGIYRLTLPGGAVVRLVKQ